MTIVPILLDARPPYLGSHSTYSLLLLPGPERALASTLACSIQRVTTTPIIALAPFAPAPEYEAALRAACPAIGTVTDVRGLLEIASELAPSDALLFVAATCHPATGLDLRPLCDVPRDDSRLVRHLLAFEGSPLRTKELTQVTTDGRLKRIQRYYEPVTWPFCHAVLASLVPVACLRLVDAPPRTSLVELRRSLMGRGIASQDIPVHGEMLDLDDEEGALAFCERAVQLRATRAAAYGAAAGAEQMRGLHSHVHPTARLLGPVVVQDGAFIDEGALIVGPALVASGARVGADAVVAQSVVLSGATIPEGTTVRQRVVAVGTDPDAGRQRRHAVGIGSAASNLSRGWRIPRPRYTTVKTWTERVVALMALAALAPLLVVVAILVRVTSQGPAFFGDPREGLDGRPFRCWKFRSMLVNADDMQRALAKQQQMDGPQFKMLFDPRVTQLGRLLRRTNVDELPQLWNVVRGEMGLVGPRPSPFRENQICVPWRQGRLSVRPGITGLWQVCRHDRILGDFHQWIYYDLIYVRNVSLALDLKILAATVLTLGGRWPVPLPLMLWPRNEAGDRLPPRTTVHEPSARPSGPSVPRPTVRVDAPKRVSR